MGFVEDARGVPLAQTWSKLEESFENAEANGRLMAAAPDLLRELEELVELVNCGLFEPAETTADARAAIAKARGADHA
jgi:hypothetical protein